MRAGIVQMNSGTNCSDNCEAAEQLIKACAEEGARLVTLPETFSWLGPEEEKPSIAEPIPGPTADFLADQACLHGIYLHGGSFFETGGPDNTCYNTTLVFSPEGKQIAKYRKIHLFDAEIDGKPYRESKCVSPGNEIAAAQIDNLKLGLSICYDVRFPELFIKLAWQRADIIAVPAAFTVPTGKAHWEILLRARAIETQTWILAPAQSGTDPAGKSYYGHSMIIDPWGNITASLGNETEGYAVAELDPQALIETRGRIPIQANRRL